MWGNFASVNNWQYAKRQASDHCNTDENMFSGESALLSTVFLESPKPSKAKDWTSSKSDSIILRRTMETWSPMSWIKPPGCILKALGCECRSRRASKATLDLATGGGSDSVFETTSRESLFKEKTGLLFSFLFWVKVGDTKHELICFSFLPLVQTQTWLHFISQVRLLIVFKQQTAINVCSSKTCQM